MVRRLVFVSLFCFSSVARAQFLNELPIGNAKAASLGNAVTADSTGTDAIHYNPAALIKIQKKTVQVNVLTAVLKSETQFGERINSADELSAGLSSGLGTIPLNDPIENTKSRLDYKHPVLTLPFLGPTKLPMLAAPVGGVALPFPDGNIVIATNVYSPLAVGYTRDDDDPGRYQGKKVTMTNIRYFNPTLAMRISDTLTLGGGVNIGWGGVAMDLDMRAPNLILAAVQEACMVADQLFEPCKNTLGPYKDIGSLSVEVENGIIPTFTLGFLFEPAPWFSWGGAYRHGSKFDLRGDYSFDYSDSWQKFWSGLNTINLSVLPNGKSASEKGKMTLEMELPKEIQTGISVKVFPRLKMNIDARWTEYSVWDSFDLHFDKNLDFLKIASIVAPKDAQPTTLLLPRNYRNTWAYGTGLEYEWNDVVSLRVGYEFRQSMADKDKQDLIIPVGDAHYYGLGLGFKSEDGSELDFSMSLLNTKGGARACQSTNANACGADNLIYNPYAGLDIKSQTQAYFFLISYVTNF